MKTKSHLDLEPKKCPKKFLVTEEMPDIPCPQFNHDPKKSRSRIERSEKIRRSLIEHSETCGEAVLSVSAIVVSAQEVSGRASHVKTISKSLRWWRGQTTEDK